MHCGFTPAVLLIDDRCKPSNWRYLPETPSGPLLVTFLRGGGRLARARGLFWFWPVGCWARASSRARTRSCEWQSPRSAPCGGAARGVQWGACARARARARRSCSAPSRASAPALWRCARSGATSAPPSCSSGSCPLRAWCVGSLAPGCGTPLRRLLASPSALTQPLPLPPSPRPAPLLRAGARGHAAVHQQGD